MTKIIIHDDGDSLHITTPLSPTKTIEEVAIKIYGDKPYMIIDESDLPNEIHFIDAFTIENNSVVVSMDRAKKLKKEQLRLERKPLLEAQDILFMQAQESGSDTSAIVAEKQRLRDITNQVDSCTDTDQLKALSCS
tara:strand:- start:379 stop:786 length:408 start_codon:yes stop_codon:yes gene_type:complete